MENVSAQDKFILGKLRESGPEFRIGFYAACFQVIPGREREQIFEGFTRGAMKRSIRAFRRAQALHPHHAEDFEECIGVIRRYGLRREAIA